MQKTAGKLGDLIDSIPNLRIYLDPTRFEKFNIREVPALVVSNNKKFDVLYGNLNLVEGLIHIADKGEVGLTRLDVEKMREE